MRLRYPALQNAALDQEDEEHNVIPGAWRDGINLDEMHHIRGGNFTSRTAKRQRLYLKAYYNSPVGSVAWQDRMVPWSHPKGVALEWRHYWKRYSLYCRRECEQIIIVNKTKKNDIWIPLIHL